MDSFESKIPGYEWCRPSSEVRHADDLVHYRPFAPGTVAVKSTEGWLVLCRVYREIGPKFNVIVRKPVTYEELNEHD